MNQTFLEKLRDVNVARSTFDFRTYKNAGVLYFTTALAGVSLWNRFRKVSDYYVQ